MGLNRNSTEYQNNYNKTYYLKYKDKLKAASNLQHFRNKQHGRRRLHIYGITQQQYEDILESQGWCCALCGKATSAKNRSLAVDHNHKTGKVRGILCLGCNSRLAPIEDERFKFLAEIYLDYHKNTEVK